MSQEKKKLSQKEKADLYDNWLAYVNGRGWTEVMAEPQKIKEKFDKLNKEIRYINELNNGLNSACDIFKGKRKQLQEGVEKWKKSSDDFRKELVESNKLHTKKALEVHQLETALAQSMDQVRRVLPIAEKNQKKLEKINVWVTKNDNKGIGNKDWTELKKILDEK